MKAIRKVKAYHAPGLLSKRNVVGVGVGLKTVGGSKQRELAVVAMVEKKLPTNQLAPDDIIPRTLDSLPTDVIEVGRIQAPPPFTQANGVYTDRIDPTPPGYSIGHKNITAGTFGCMVRRVEAAPTYAWREFILSNNHVLANSNAGKPGDDILQPGPYDGGGYKIATLTDFVPVSFIAGGVTCSLVKWLLRTLNTAAQTLGSFHRFSASKLTTHNLVDAAIAEPHDYSDVIPEIIDLGVPRGVRKAALGMTVQKSGRTTGHTRDRVDLVHATVQVSYGLGRMAVFQEQIIAGPMSAGGDSGSLVLDNDQYAVGLLFAGSDKTTIFSPIAFVLDALNVELVT